MSKQNTKALISESSKVVTYELPIIQSNETLLVDARIVHQKLNSKQKFSDWIKNRIADYGFESDKDFFLILGKSTGGRKSKEYHLTLDTAKEIAMVERNEQGRAIRRFFIEAEKELHNKRLYGQKMNLTQIKTKVEVRRINGFIMYPYRKVQELLGYSTKTSANNVRRCFAGLIVMMDNKAWVAEQYVQVMVARATARAKTTEALNTQPVLPFNFGDVSLLNH